MAQTVNFDTTETLNITCREGDTFSMTLTMKDSSGTALPLVTDGYTFHIQIKEVNRVGRTRSAEEGKVILQTPGLTKGEIEDAVSFESPILDDSGNVTLEASAETMSKIRPGSYIYDIKYIKPSNTGLDIHKAILRGSFTVNSQITDIY
jgi:hypothetical protein